jgi:hypothetical protein
VRVRRKMTIRPPTHIERAAQTAGEGDGVSDCWEKERGIGSVVGGI